MGFTKYCSTCALSARGLHGMVVSLCCQGVGLNALQLNQFKYCTMNTVHSTHYVLCKYYLESLEALSHVGDRIVSGCCEVAVVRVCV
jgi:hypothetical protein